MLTDLPPPSQSAPQEPELLKPGDAPARFRMRSAKAATVSSSHGSVNVSKPADIKKLIDDEVLIEASLNAPLRGKDVSEMRIASALPSQSYTINPRQHLQRDDIDKKSHFSRASFRDKVFSYDAATLIDDLRVDDKRRRMNLKSAKAPATLVRDNDSLNDAFNRKLIEKGTSNPGGVSLEELQMKPETIANWNSARRVNA